MVHVTGFRSVGAEATVESESWLGAPAVSKHRQAKGYRHPDLDRRLRAERTRAEASLLVEARAGGVPVPAVLDVDAQDSRIRLSLIDGETLKKTIDERPQDGPRWSRAFGRAVGRLHGAGIVHGDLTTSNVHVRSHDVVLLDFGLASRSQETEDRGVDLHLVERTFESTHPGVPGLLAAFLEGYRETFPEARLVERRMDEIKARARYA